MNLIIFAAIAAFISFFAFASQSKPSGNSFFLKYKILIGVIFGLIALGILAWMKFH